LRKEFDLTGSLRIKKFNLKKENYDLEEIKQPIFFWDVKNKEYIPFTDILREDLEKGNLRV